MHSDPDKLLKQHAKLIHSDNRKVLSHTQRQQGEWILNTIMLEGYDVPFRYKRKKLYKDITGARVNVTYYPESITVANNRGQTTIFSDSSCVVIF